MKISLYITLLLALPVAAQEASLESRFDRTFSANTHATPGCVAGVAQRGETLMLKAYGMADLEHGIANASETIFEAGSIAKQFTAAAVALLARDGKLNLDEPLRKYLPELPDYGVPITIRHALAHTSGLRDWGDIVWMAGWRRGTRLYTQTHVLEIASRQSALNFMPGTNWSYSNTGYVLAAILVERVSGMSFAKFTQERIFTPLAMNNTSWRDDRSRVIKQRAYAYAKRADGYHHDMPFEEVVGSTGLLTTVGDLLKWNQNFATTIVGDAQLMADAQTPGKFSDGRLSGYGMGLEITERGGLKSVGHGGATGGYRAQLSRYPLQQLSVAVLCNAGNANAFAHAAELAQLFIKSETPVRPAAYPTTDAQWSELAGLYRDVNTGLILSLLRTKEGVSMENGPPVLATAPQKFLIGNGFVMELGQKDVLHASDPSGMRRVYQKVERAQTDAAELAQLNGTYYSADALSSVRISAEGSVLRATLLGVSVTMKPLYKDAFNSEFGTVIFQRDSKGEILALSLVSERVWNMRFERQPATPALISSVTK